MQTVYPSKITTSSVHTDEIWDIEWSHDGQYLASAGRDKTLIIWEQVRNSSNSALEWAPRFILRDQPHFIGCLAWSKDDSILLMSAENFIKFWNTRTGLCIRSLEKHSEMITSLAWLSDGSGFISGGLDRKIVHWNADGTVHDDWGETPIRVTDLAITPDRAHLVAVGMYYHPLPTGDNPQPPRNTSTNDAGSDHRFIVYDLFTKQIESTVQLTGELTSVKISQDSQHALINHSPDEVYLWDLRSGRLAREYTGQRQGRYVIRSCFGGIDDNLIVSGSEDGNVYVWHRDTGALLEVLAGHGKGSVNSVTWNPRNERMFASCSDDHTIRIWEMTLLDVVESTTQ